MFNASSFEVAYVSLKMGDFEGIAKPPLSAPRKWLWAWLPFKPISIGYHNMRGISSVQPRILNEAG